MKYIVYKTTNLINNYIYIGVHKTRNVDVFDGYLGCGVNIKIPYTYKHSKTKFQQAIGEFGVKNFRRETLGIYDTWEEASEVEELLVNNEFLKREDVYNMVLGGFSDKNGVTVYQYDNKGNYLKQFLSYESAADELNVQASSIRRAVLYNYRIKENYFANYLCDKLDLSQYNTSKKTTVHRYLKEGVYDNTFSSYGEASRESNTSPSNVYHSAVLGYCLCDTYYFSFIKSNSFDDARKKQIDSREVHKYSCNGDYIESFKTQKEAEKLNKYSNITKSIKLKSIDENGFIWGLEKLSKYNCKTPKNKSKSVGQYNDSGELLIEWESARKCALEVGSSVTNVLNGKYEKHKGFIYKYIE